MTTDTPTLTFRAQSFYVACAPTAGLCSYGNCFEEAANDLAEQLRSSTQSEQATGEERNTAKNTLRGGNAATAASSSGRTNTIGVRSQSSATAGRTMSSLTTCAVLLCYRQKHK